jgi:hypothetical protein
VSHKDETIPPGDEWYYELDGRAHGPFRRSALDELLGCAGETAADVRIRKGAEGEWSSFRSGSSVVGTPWLAGTPSGPSAPPAARAGESRAQRSRLQGEAKGFASLFHRNRDIAAAMGVWILLNVLFLLFWQEPHARERRYLATLQGIVTEADQMRAKPASQQEWQQMLQRTQKTLAPMVQDLQKSASSSELPRQQLLWCARDLAPKIMGPQSKERDQHERRLKQYLQSLEDSVGRR